ncbi:hypothetical protein AMS62_06360 [Bacillus sp. FJAT-18019]|uniref:Lipoprotein n=1 Tax=Paenibacillus solani TaxID=1705565 RepID=A0A0M1P0Z6_9BACL|nr:hypothetical protein [Paenibacillus solani]KOP64910.1 hypothetical protein AMS62_06360 [Bacillus sp. FJAT-18019]KOR87779.1 hypothetical protein AM231_00550 [Paenibacillus solani]
MVNKLTITLISILMVLLFAACGSQDSEINKEVIETSKASDNEEVKKIYSKDQIEDLKRNSIQNFIKENPNYQKEDIESKWVVVLGSELNNKKSLLLTVKDQESNDLLVLGNGIEDLSKIEIGQSLIIVTTKLWKQSNPPRNDVLEIIHLSF